MYLSGKLRMNDILSFSLDQCSCWDNYQVERQCMQYRCSSISQHHIMCKMLHLYFLVEIVLVHMHHTKHCRIYSLLFQLNTENMMDTGNVQLNIYLDGMENIEFLAAYLDCFCNQCHNWSRRQWIFDKYLACIDMVFHLLN